MGYNIVKLANEILDMNFEIRTQKAEIKRLREYEKKYNNILKESIKHGDTMMSNYMNAVLSKKQIPKKEMKNHEIH